MRGSGALGAVTLLLGACNSTSTPPAPTATASASATPVAISASAAPSASPPPFRESLPQATKPSCRVVLAKGEVQMGGSPLKSGELVDGAAWIELPTQASLSLRHTSSTREFRFVGPARVLPCVQGGEDVLLAEGTLETAAGAGARPGGEVTVYTPFGTISYGDAQIQIHSSKTKVDLTIAKGEAWLRPAKGTNRKGPEKLDAKAPKASMGPRSATETLVKACEDAATEAVAQLQRLQTPPPDAGPLGDRAAAHLDARRAARATCGVAQVAVSTAGPERSALEARVAEAARRSQAVSAPPGPGPAAKSSAP